MLKFILTANKAGKEICPTVLNEEKENETSF